MGTSVVDLLHDVQLHGDHAGRRLEHPVWDLLNSHLQLIQIARNIVLRRHTTIYISCRGHSPGRTCAICCTAEAVRQYATTWCRRCHTGIHQLCQPYVASTMYCPPCAAFFSIRMIRLRRSNRMQHQGRDVADMLREDLLYVCHPQWPVCSLGWTTDYPDSPWLNVPWNPAKTINSLLKAAGVKHSHSKWEIRTLSGRVLSAKEFRHEPLRRAQRFLIRRRHTMIPTPNPQTETPPNAKTLSVPCALRTM
jgi:hypothetical protein